VAPTGSDAGDCTEQAPCASFARAYDVAHSGDVVEVAAGVLGPQKVPEGDKRLTFHGAPGNAVRQLLNDASNVTFDGIDVDAGATTPNGAAFEDHGNTGVTFRHGRIGNVVDQKGALLGGQVAPDSLHLVLDDVEFHDVVQRTAGVHNECVFSQSPGVTIRNSTFRDCATMDLSVNRGDWWGQRPYGGVTLENNVFGHSVNGGGWHYYGLAWFVGAFRGARVVNNTFENAVLIDRANIGDGPYSGVWANNIGGGWGCLAGVTFRGNVGERCDRSDVAVSPLSSCRPPACRPGVTMPVGWAGAAGGDFRLTPGSPAIGAGDPAYAPARDSAGTLRGKRPDAGALQLRAAAPARQARGTGGGGDGPPAGAIAAGIAAASLLAAAGTAVVLRRRTRRAAGPRSR
jgi:hypothetical protein